jgi:hypothetical protein
MVQAGRTKASARAGATEAMRDNPRLASSCGRSNSLRQAPSPCDSVDWPSAASSRVMATVAGGSLRQTLRCRRHSDGGGGSRACGARRRCMNAMANSHRGVNFARRAVARSAGAVPGKEGDDLGCSVWVSNRQGDSSFQEQTRPAPSPGAAAEPVETRSSESGVAGYAMPSLSTMGAST